MGVTGHGLTGPHGEETVAAPRGWRMNVPLRRVAVICGAMLFALLANVSFVQTFRVEALRDDRRNQRALISRFDHPRGDILLRDGTLIASHRRVDGRFAYQRTYLDGPVFAPVTGYVSLFGNTGIERTEDAELSGSATGIRLRRWLSDTPEQGASVVLTIDEKAQRAAYEGLAATGRMGAAVALDPRTGAILAMASYPSYDPNAYATFDSAELARLDRRLRSDPARPLLNRAVERTYPPGSAFKPVTAAAALAAGKVTPAGSVSAPRALRLPGTDVSLRNFGGAACGDGTPPLAQAFMLSCNTAFARLGLELGADELRDQAEAFGFGDSELAVPLPVAESVFPERLDRPQTALAAIGQFDVRATPLAIAMISAAIGNGGTMMHPYLVREVRMADGTVLDETDPTVYGMAVDPSIAGQLTAMMVMVTAPGGTGARAALPGVQVAAKTGTAENAADGEEHAVFTAFAPADDPKVAVGVVVEHGGSGGRVAAPIARAILEALL